jgi:hypothetical protein
VAADHRGKRVEIVRAVLVGFSEVPSLSVPGRGFFRAVIDEDGGTITYTLSYDGVPNVTQSHLHLGSHHTTGGISVWLCSNLASPPTPAGTQACPQGAGEITGQITLANVVGPTAQGILAGEFEELLTAIRNGTVYVNLHSQAFGAGEIRGQLF